MDDFISRLTKFMEAIGVNDNQITLAAQLSNGLIGKAKANGKALSALNIEKILYAYPELSADWLLTGRGEMLKTNRTSRHNSVNQVPVIECKDSDITQVKQISEHQNRQTRPRIPLDAAAGSLSIALTSVSESECEQIPVIPTMPRYDFTIVARGDSMTPVIESGDELVCRFIKESAFIQWGRVHVLDTAQGIVVKHIFESDNNILCRSNNSNYPDFLVSKDEIYHMALVVGLLRHF